MLSEAHSGLVRKEFGNRYRDVLHEHLPDDMKGFAPFFANLTRLETLAAMLSRHLPSGDGPVLNVGSGPFAAEIFVGALQGRPVVSFDYTRSFAPFYSLFRAEGLLGATTFLRADALSVAFRPGSFDAIVIHDVLYETALDAEALVQRFTPMLRPGGLLYLDYMNAGTERLWRMLGKERAYRRYRPAEILRIVGEAGLQVLEVRPHSGAEHPAVRLFHAALWRGLGTSNTFAVVARSPA